jgi:hypothetical protein
MSIEALFPKHKQVYEKILEKIIILINKPKSHLEINEWEINEISWTISDIKNSYLITNKFLHQEYLQHGNIKKKSSILNIQYKNINISKLLPNKYELRLYIKFTNILNNKIMEKYNLSSFTIKNPEIEKKLGNIKLEKDSCFSNNCIILEKKK